MTKRKAPTRGGLIGKAQRALRSSPARVKAGVNAKSPSGPVPKTRTSKGRTQPSSFAAPKKPSTRRTFGAPTSNTTSPKSRAKPLVRRKKK